jgi:hypothetical protein
VKVNVSGIFICFEWICKKSCNALSSVVSGVNCFNHKH